MSVFETAPQERPPWAAYGAGQEQGSSEAPWGGESPWGEAPWGSETSPALESPFATASLTETLGSPAPLPPAQGGTESPFRLGFTPATEADREAEALGELLAELEDEQFDEAIAQLVDEGAAQHLASGAAWSSSEAAPALATAELEAWLAPLQSEADRMLEALADRLDGENLDALGEAELEALVESYRPAPGLLPESHENFLGGLLNAAKKVAKTVGKGIAAVGNVVSFPLRMALNALKKLVRPLLRKVLQTAIGHLPVAVQPIARTLAARLGGEAEAAAAAPEHNLGREFQLQVAGVLLAPGEAEAEAIVAEAEAQAAAPGSAALLELDQARAQFAQQLTSLPPGQAPVAELEQFLPALMAAQQAIRLGIRIIGRDKVVGFLANLLAKLIQGLVGHDAAVALGRPIADLGLRALGLEAPPSAETTLAGEALTATVEETVRDVLQLPAEAFEDPLRLEAEVQEAFAGAAARNIPNAFLRPDLDQLETAGEGGVWIHMPRAARPRYRYKKYTQVFFVPLSRQVAQSIPTRDGGTLETLLADRGVKSWPAHVEVHLYEAMPGTNFGHMAEFERDPEATVGETLDEFQPLTPETAAMLINEPKLGRHITPGHQHHAPGDQAAGYGPAYGPGHGQPAAHGPAGHHPALAAHPAAHPASAARPVPPGTRHYRVRLPGQARPGVSRPRHRFRVTFGPRGTGTIQVHLHLSEREAQELGGLLHRGPLSASLTWLKHRYYHVAPAILTARLLSRGAPPPAGPGQGAHHGTHPAAHHAAQPAAHHAAHHAVRLALRITESLTHALSAFVRTHQAELVSAVQNPAQGLTFTFTFHAADPAALAAGHVPTPQVTVRAGHQPHPHHPQPHPAQPHPAQPHPQHQPGAPQHQPGGHRAAAPAAQDRRGHRYG